MAEAQYRQPPEESDKEEDAQVTMGFLDHLDELRRRLVYSCIALAAGTLVTFFFVERIADFVLASMLRVLPAGTPIITTRPGEGLSFYMDLALMGGVVLAAPFVTYQIWRFIAPGLYARERRLVIPITLLAVVGTMAGALFSHYLLFPSMMSFFASFGSPRMRFMPRVEETFELYKNMLIGMVAVFQIPTLVCFLARLRIVTARFLWRHIQYAILVSFVAAALLTPSPDPWNQAIFAGPMIALYIVSIAIAWIVAPRRPAESGNGVTSGQLKLVFAAAVIDQARRQRERSQSEFPRLWRGSR